MPTSDLQTWGGQAVAFGPFRLYPEQRVLLRADKPLSLGSRAREILLVLVERAGEIVRRQTLMPSLTTWVLIAGCAPTSLRAMSVLRASLPMVHRTTLSSLAST